MELTFEVNTRTTFLEDVARKKRKDEDYSKLYNGQPPKKKKPGPVPRATPRPPLPRKAPTRLRKDRPVRTGLPMDVWETILSFCSLEKLLKLRVLSWTFYSALKNDGTWRRARIHQFGPDQPDPPDGLTEMQYADLLVGVGCQGAGCKEKCTRRTYWAFRRRWCEKCCVLNLVKARVAKVEYNRYEEVSRCVPYAMYDSWNHYQWAGHYPDPPLWAGTYGAQSQVYSKFDLEKFENRLQNMDPLGINSTWLDEQAALNETYMDQLQSIERWVELDRKQREKERAETREVRANFFSKRALQMDPPLEFDVLEKCRSYERSIQISKYPTEKSWQILRDKLFYERERAEVETKRIRRAAYHRGYREFLACRSDDTIERRKSQRTVEQDLVLSLADQVIHDVFRDTATIHDSAIVSFILRGTYDAYQNLDITAKPLCMNGVYRLIMDDARHVYRKRILPLINKLDFKRHATIRLLRCPSISCSKTFQFEDLMNHLQTYPTHAKGFQCDINVFPNHGVSRAELSWYCLEWPRNLPVLPTHQVEISDWDADAEVSCLRAISPQSETKITFNSALGGHNTSSLEPGKAFTLAILHAANQLRHINLSKTFKSVIALEFARRLLLMMRDTPTAEDCPKHVTETLNATGLEEIFDKLYCCRCPSNDIFSSFGMTPHTFIEVARHYITNHSGRGSWAGGMLTSPENDPLGGKQIQNDLTVAQATRQLFSGVDPHLMPYSDDFFLDA